MKQKIRIQYTDFWGGFDATKHSVTRILQEDYDVEIVNENPQLLVYSVFGNKHKEVKNCIKLNMSGENSIANFSECDYCIGTVRMDLPGRYFYFPYAYHALGLDSHNTKELTPELTKRRFCCFIYSHTNRGLGAYLRTEFCKKLMEYKHVDCPGRALHNMDAPELSARGAGNWHESKNKFVGKYKFIIAFEKSDGVGYITEKIVDAYINNVVPIYWGSTADVAPFPKESMICAQDYPTLEALVERVRQVDEDDELYMNILRANPLRNLDFLKMISSYHTGLRKFIKSIGASVFELRPQYEDWVRSELESGGAISTDDLRIFTRIIPRNPLFDVKVLSLGNASTEEMASDESPMQVLRSDVAASTKQLVALWSQACASQEQQAQSQEQVRDELTKQSELINNQNHIVKSYHGIISDFRKEFATAMESVLTHHSIVRKYEEGLRVIIETLNSQIKLIEQEKAELKIQFNEPIALLNESMRETRRVVRKLMLVQRELSLRWAYRYYSFISLFSWGAHKTRHITKKTRLQQLLKEIQTIKKQYLKPW